eukprot:6211868-Pleurochrysis_carterae.AAC.1
MEGVSAVPKSSGMDMAGTPEMSPSRDARLLEVKDDAYSGLLARVRRSPDNTRYAENRITWLRMGYI